jgi:hypothetical protein
LIRFGLRKTKADYYGFAILLLYAAGSNGYCVFIMTALKIKILPGFFLTVIHG